MLCFLNLRYNFEKNVSYNAKHSLRRCCLVILAITTYILVCTHTHTRTYLKLVWIICQALIAFLMKSKAEKQQQQQQLSLYIFASSVGTLV